MLSFDPGDDGTLNQAKVRRQHQKELNLQVRHSRRMLPIWLSPRATEILTSLVSAKYIPDQMAPQLIPSANPVSSSADHAPS
jgi:hypothetical protein